MKTGSEMWLFLAISSTLVYIEGIKVTVETNQGLIRGLRADDGDYYKFLGIPYARVDKNKPFGPATPCTKFRGIYKAYNDTIACPQVHVEKYAGLEFSLDCLRLNIYVPEQASSINKLPVLIYIHGGGFSNGTGIVGPKYFMEHDIIVASIQYRLGPYGFMCLDTPDVPGNQGLKDQYLGLQWLKNNICAFGGDTNKITVMGESAGSMSLDLHLLSKKPKIYHQAILESGTALCPARVLPSDRTVPLKLAAELDLKSDDMQESLRFLEEIDPTLVIAASSKLLLTLRPCVEKQFENIDRFVSEHPEHSDVSRAKNIAIISGYNTLEEYYVHQNESAEFYRTWDVFHEYIVRNFNFRDDREKEDSAKYFYIGDDEISENVKLKLLTFASDFQFNYPIQRSMLKYLLNEGQTIYHYYFTYTGQRNVLSNQHPVFATHTDELKYIFSNKSDKYKKPSQADNQAIARITTLWSNFVKYGDPTPETTDLIAVKWLPLTKDKVYYLHFDSELKLGNRPNRKRMEFWEQFYKLHKCQLRANLDFYR